MAIQGSLTAVPTAEGSGAQRALLVARAQAGLTASGYMNAASPNGLALPLGDTGSVGMAGLTLGGGIGDLVRNHALAIDEEAILLALAAIHRGRGRTAPVLGEEVR